MATTFSTECMIIKGVNAKEN